jgi:hypothetical protein
MKHNPHDPLADQPIVYLVLRVSYHHLPPFHPVDHHMELETPISHYPNHHSLPIPYIHHTCV